MCNTSRPGPTPHIQVWPRSPRTHFWHRLRPHAAPSPPRRSPAPEPHPDEKDSFCGRFAGLRPVVLRERVGFQSSAHLPAARSTGNLRVRENRPGGPSPGRPMRLIKLVRGPCGPVRSGNMAPRGDRSAPEGLPPPSSGLAVAGAPARRGAWGSWGDPGRAVVQICCKGAPGRDRPREEARNTNDPPPAPRLDPGLCNRFGQLAPPRAGRRPRRTPRSAGRPL